MICSSRIVRITEFPLVARFVGVKTNDLIRINYNFMGDFSGSLPDSSISVFLAEFIRRNGVSGRFSKSFTSESFEFTRFRIRERVTEK